MSCISLRNVSYKNILRNVSFGIEKGSYVAIVGKNGSGKSTLARIICGLEQPDSGEVQVADGARLGIVFQSPKNQVVSSLVSRDVAFGVRNMGFSAGEAELRTIEALSAVDLLEKASSPSYALSLGQTQKLAFAANIAMRPDVLLLDEALSMLDPESRESSIRFLRDWHRRGNTILHITHDFSEVQEADAVIVLAAGEVVFYGTKNAFLTDGRFVPLVSGEPLPIANRAAFSKKSAGAEPAIRLENVCFEYGDSAYVRDLNFSLAKGSLTALTGASGAGKSTLLELCAGLLENSSGTIYCDSRPVLAQQNASAALFEPFAADDVAFGPRNQGKSGAELVSVVKAAMDKAGLPFDEFGERRTFFLSGGEQRRLAIAGILAVQGEVLLFDEPTAGLDGDSRLTVMRLLRELAAEGKTVLFSTHRRDEADFADRELHLHAGKITFDSGSSPDGQKQLAVLAPNPAASMLASLRAVSSGANRIKGKRHSVISRLPAALRILLFLLLFTASIAVRPLWLCLVLLAASVLYCVLAGFSLRKFVGALIKLLPFLLVFSVFQLMFHPPLADEIRFTTWRFLTITPSKLLFCLAAIIRTDAAVACISAFFVSTPEYDLLDGLSVLLRPFSALRIPVRFFILIVEVIFRFIPLLIDEASCIIKTQAIRGGLGEAGGILAKIRAVLPLIVPLIIQTIKRSELLADAITMRCFR